MSRATFQLRGWHVLAALLAFFGLVIAVNVAFAVVATRSFPGEDVPRSYLQGLQYNDTLAERRTQAALGWSAAAALRGDETGAFVEVTLRTSEGAAVDGAALTGDLQWPTNARFDRALAFESVGAGRYVARLGALPDGRWRLRARAENADGALDFESELAWPILR
jgi:nitrogen fixation protein FixH